ncbi:MAG: hypothetical protein Q7T55_21385, partial [Solirubrobacteraceae bacterium]|nr:hypothetical protein [Solirubrobacteraceae bacterium]
APGGRFEGPLAPTLDAIGPSAAPVRVPAPGLRFSRSPLAEPGRAPNTGVDDAVLNDPDARWPQRT